ncbi:hypothetical protein Rs2_17960 [Raphanus sativus]|nr:hypothetical protein Rs2_17960 [Raphanus sativus]
MFYINLTLSGAETYVWKDVWLPTNPPRPAIPRDGNTETGLMVHHLIDFERKEWNIDLVQELVAAVDVPRILSLKVSRTGRRDDYTWSHTNSGNYTVRSGYDVAVKQRKQGENEAMMEPSTTEISGLLLLLVFPLFFSFACGPLGAKVAFALVQRVSKILKLSSPLAKSRVIFSPISARQSPEAAACFKNTVHTIRTRIADSGKECSSFLRSSASLKGSRLDIYSSSVTANGTKA